MKGTKIIASRLSDEDWERLDRYWRYHPEKWTKTRIVEAAILEYMERHPKEAEDGK